MQSSQGDRGATLIDTLVSTALMLVVFVGIAGAFKLSIDVITNNKARAGAIALANERMEYIRSLPYEEVGVVGGIPSGDIPHVETVELNGITYERRTLALYADDPKDGTGGADENDIITDYKAVKAEVSWESRYGTRRISLTSRVSPDGIESAAAGGVLALTIQNAAGQPIQLAQVEIVNTEITPNVDLILYTDEFGEVNVIGAPPGAGYEITVSRSGYTTAVTYDATAENTNPTPGHLTVADQQTTSATFAIDLVATKNVRTYEPAQAGEWSDSFADDSKVGQATDTVVAGGRVRLLGDPGTYASSGTVRSVAITPENISEWSEFSWDDTSPPQTTILYRVYNLDGTTLIPDGQIAGNSTGFTDSPVDLSGVSTTTYPSLSLHATLGSVDPDITPEINSWNASYEQGWVALPNITFALKGTKTIGSGPSGFIFKYDESSLSSGPTAGVNIPNLEWDTYTLSVNGANGYDIASSCAPQPEALNPGDYVTTSLILVPHTTHSFLVDVRSSAGAVIPNASVRLYRTGYDTTQSTDSCGYVHFPSLSSGSPGGGNAYSVDVSATGFQSYSVSDVSVSGTSQLSVVLNSL